MSNELQTQAAPTAEGKSSADESAPASSSTLRNLDYDSGQAALSTTDQNKAPPPERVTVTGSLWAKDRNGADKPPSVEDVRQGTAGDCYLFAAMIAVVHANPGTIKSMIKANRNGSYTVTFGVQEGLLSFVGYGDRVTETVRLSYEKDEKRGYKARSGALWPLVIERAWAQYNGGIENIEGGQAGEGVQCLTGKELTRIDLSEHSIRYIMNQAKSALDNSRPLTLFGGQGDGTKKQQADSRRVSNLLLGHAYAILDVDMAGSRLKLHNPWGRKHPNGDGWVEAAIVRRFFNEMHINDTQ